jgi:His-Xaa-Ser system protein HxsD
MKIYYDKELYPKDVVIKSAYAFTDRAYIHLDLINDKYEFDVTIKDASDQLSKGEIDNELLMQSARYLVEKETKNVREIILGRALASSMIQKNADINEEDHSGDATEILKDWFSK